MPPVFGPRSPSSDPLEVLGGGRGTARPPSHSDEQRALLAGQPLLDHDPSPGVPERRPGELGRDVGLGLVRGRR